jgi:hypothetical protein
MTPGEIIAEARYVLNDTDPLAYRQSDEELLQYVNSGLCECSTLAPQLFYATGDMQCAPGETEQGVTFEDAQAIAEIIRVKGGRVILPGDMQALSLFNPAWGQDAAGPALNWFRHTGDPLRFYVYPAAPDGQTIEVKYVRSPAKVGLNDEITDLPPALHPALVNYVIAKAENKDDEHVNSGRAVAAYQQFLAMLKPA